MELLDQRLNNNNSSNSKSADDDDGDEKRRPSNKKKETEQQSIWDIQVDLFQYENRPLFRHFFSSSLDTSGTILQNSIDQKKNKKKKEEMNITDLFVWFNSIEYLFGSLLFQQQQQLAHRETNEKALVDINNNNNINNNQDESQTLIPNGECTMFLMEQSIQIPSVPYFYHFCHYYAKMGDQSSAVVDGSSSSSFMSLAFSSRIDANLLSEYLDRIENKYGETQSASLLSSLGTLDAKANIVCLPELLLKLKHEKVYKWTTLQTDLIICHRILVRLIRNMGIIHLIQCMQHDASTKANKAPSTSAGGAKARKEFGGVRKTSKKGTTEVEEKTEPLVFHQPVLPNSEEETILTHMQHAMSLVQLILQHAMDNEANHSTSSRSTVNDKIKHSWEQRLHLMATDTLLTTLKWFNDKTRQYMQQNGYSIESCIKDCFSWISMHLQLVQQSSSWVSREQRMQRQAQQRQAIEFLKHLCETRTNSKLSALFHLWIQSVRRGRIGARRIAFMDTACLQELNQLTNT